MNATCEPPPRECPGPGLDSNRCVASSGLLRPVVAQGILVDASVDLAELDRLQLEPGAYWSMLPDPDRGCAYVVVSFDAETGQGRPPDRTEAEAKRVTDTGAPPRDVGAAEGGAL